MTEQERKIKKDKFFKYLNEFIKKQEKSELINLTDIYGDYGRPKCLSPKRILHSRIGKQLIQSEIDKNELQIEKVIRYQGQTVFGNYSLAIHYLQSIDAFNKYLFIDFLMKSEPKILEKFLRH